MELLRIVDGYAHQPVVFFKEFAPFVGFSDLVFLKLKLHPISFMKNCTFIRWLWVRSFFYVLKSRSFKVYGDESD